MGTKPTRPHPKPMPSHTAMLVARLIKESNNDSVE